MVCEAASVRTLILALAIAPIVGLTSPDGVADAAADVRRLAVIVGANAGTEWRIRLRHAARDAEKMATVLEELGGVAPDDVTLLTDDPTADDVIAALEEVERIAHAAREAGTDVALLFYYSGHASAEALELSGSELPIATLRARLRDSRANVRLAVLDACHSGSAATRPKGGRRSRNKVSFEFDEAMQTEGYAILTSSAAGEESQESDELLGSFFTHHLVSGMRGAADSDGDARVTLGEAYRYAYARTLRHTARQARVAQHPHFDFALQGGQDVVLTAVPAAQARVRLAGRADDAQWILYSPAAGLVVAELDERTGQTVTVAVPEGDLEVYRRSGQRVARGYITAEAGSEVVLSRRELEEVPLTAYLRKGQMGLSLSANLGVQTFGAQAVREGYIGPAPLFSIGIRYRDVWAYGLDVAADIGFSHMSQQIVVPEGSSSQRMTQVQIGLALLYRIDFGSLSLSAGPRVAYLYLHRDPELVEAQDVSTVAVGGSLGAWWRFSERISVGFDGRISYVPLPFEDDLERDQWMVEVQAAAAFHF